MPSIFQFYVLNLSYHTNVLLWTINLVTIADTPLCIFLYWSIASSKYCPFEGPKGRFHVLGHRSVSPCIAQDTSHHSFIHFYFILPMNTILNSWNFVVRKRIIWQPKFAFAVLSIHYCGQRNMNEASLPSAAGSPCQYHSTSATCWYRLYAAWSCQLTLLLHSTFMSDT